MADMLVFFFKIFIILISPLNKNKSSSPDQQTKFVVILDLISAVHSKGLPMRRSCLMFFLILQELIILFDFTKFLFVELSNINILPSNLKS